jgi:peptidoglycan hydrolase CwlO-like protein
LSILTKVFVVLLVLFAMITSAAEIVFVQTTDASKEQIATLQAKYDNEAKGHSQDRNDADSKMLELRTQIASLQAQIGNLQSSLQDQRKEYDNQAMTLANSANDNATLKAEVAAMADAMKASQDNNGKMQAIVSDLRTSLDKLQSEHNDDSGAIAEKTNLYESANRELEFTKEQLQDLQTKSQSYLRMLQEHGISADQATSSAETNPMRPVPPITGHVSQKTDIGGVPYVTLTVGSADSVSVPMLFYVFDQDKGQFLGQVTIEKVDPNDSIGRLSGPSDTLALVRAGNEVRTRIASN